MTCFWSKGNRRVVGSWRACHGGRQFGNGFLLLGRGCDASDITAQRRLIPVLREWTIQATVGVHKRCLP